jgi:hypothetical protein
LYLGLIRWPSWRHIQYLLIPKRKTKMEKKTTKGKKKRGKKGKRKEDAPAFHG